LPLIVAAAVVGAVMIAAVAVTGPDDPRKPARAVEAVQPTATPTQRAPARVAPSQTAHVDAITTAAVAGVTAWAAPDESARQQALTGTATGTFSDAMQGVDPQLVGPCVPLTAEHAAPGIGGAARVRVECDGGRELDVDLVTEDGRWLVISILLGDA